MKGIIYRLGISIKEVGEQLRIVLLIRVGLYVKGLV